MLILVGVTINFALNGGIINKAKQASSQYQIEADREALLSCVIASIGLDGKVDFSILDSEVSKMGFSGSNGTYTSKAGNVFTVDENGNITYTGEGAGAEDPDLAFLKTLIGTNFMDIVLDWSGPVFSIDGLELDLNEVNNLSSEDFIDNSDGSYDVPYPMFYKSKPYTMVVRQKEGDNQMPILNVTTRKATPQSSTSSSNYSEDTPNEEPTVEYTEWTYNSSTGKYEKGKSAYALGEEITNAKVLQELGIESTGTYTGKWTVIGFEDNKLKLVSSTYVADVELGYKDEVANSSKTDEEYNAMSEQDKIDRVIASYNRATTTLNEATVTATGISTARSVKLQDFYNLLGEENIVKGEHYGYSYNYYYDSTSKKILSKKKAPGSQEWEEPYTTGHTSATYIDTYGNKTVVDSDNDEVTLTNGDIYYELSSSQLSSIYNLNTLTYWLADTYVSCGDEDVAFNVRKFHNKKIQNNSILSTSEKFSKPHTTNNGVCAIIYI